MNHWHSLPPEVYTRVEQSPATVLLESTKTGAAEPWTRLFTAPLRVVEVTDPAELPDLFAQIESAVAAGLFAAGFFAYECGNCFEPKAAMRPSLPGQPLAWFGIYDRCYLFDHLSGTFLGDDPPELVLADHKDQNTAAEDTATELPLKASLCLTEDQYVERIAAIHEWIRAGDIYQLNFTAPLALHAPGSSAALYCRLQLRQPVDYGAFLHWRPNSRILSFSPELFFRLEQRGCQRHITTRPMKGTVARGHTTREDQALAEWLRNDAKNRSENVMIVDLLRNDLGRLCNFGSVRVESLFATERYRTLWQMTSTVSGELRPEVGFQQIFRALFPCGSITGAPKVRAMQLLAHIEEEPRGVYTGSIGFFSQEQTVFNVAIRTLELDGEDGKMGVGSGIVIDSDAAEEFRECLLKMEFLTRRPNSLPTSFSLIETLLWRSDYPLIEIHLDRLEDSAHYFGFPCDRSAVKDALLAHAAAFQGPETRKVRLLLDCNGYLSIASEVLPESADAGNSQPIRVRVASQRTDPSDTMLFHKTTRRPVYTAAFKAAVRAGYDEVLFINTRGEVTEGAISNIFIEKDGHWFTPPVECGLLAGVFRRHLLETHPGMEERVLYADDLRNADAIHLSNAVRGVRRAVIDWVGRDA